MSSVLPFMIVRKTSGRLVFAYKKYIVPMGVTIMATRYEVSE